MINVNIKLLISYILLLITFMLPSNVFADGGAFKSRVDNSSWLLFKEDSQLCFINYQDETQKMLINVKLNDKFEEEKALWLFPIPAKQDETRIDLINSAPTLKGKNFEAQFDMEIKKYFMYIYASQIYTLPIITASGTSLTGLFNKAGDGVDVVQKVEKYGITTELISVKNKQNFIDYLIKHKIKFSDEFNKILDEYIGKDYIFVLSWLSNSKEYKNNNNFPIEVFVTFKTPKIFFPLKFTSIYGHLNISIFVYVINFVTPELFGNIFSKTKIEYLIMPDYNPSDELSKFYFNIKNFKELKYTKISINSEAQDFTNDLWINPSAPLRISIMSMIYSNTDIFFVLLFLALSCISSLIAGSIIFFDHKPYLKGFMALGLMNMTSILGIIIVSYSMNFEDLLSIKKLENKRLIKYSKVILSSLIWALILSSITLYTVWSRFYHVDEYIKAFSIYFSVIFCSLLLYRSIHWLNHRIALFITAFSIIFMILSLYSNSLLDLLINHQSELANIFH